MFTYRDPEQLAEAMGQGYADLRFTPIGTGPFQATLVNRQVGKLLCWRGTMTPAINHSISAADQALVIFLDEGSPPMSRNGVTITEGDLVVVPPNVDCDTRIREGSSWGAVALPAADLDRGHRLESVPLPARLLAELRRLHRNAMRAASFDPAKGRWSEDRLRFFEDRRRYFEDQLRYGVLDCLAPQRQAVWINGSNERRVIRRFEELVDANRDWPLTMADICEEVGTTPRSLRRYCENHFGMGPREYIGHHRLNLARRDLARGDPSETTVADIALRYGFTGHGRFAGEYRRAFGETPSETLRTSDWPIVHSPWPEPS